MPHASRALHASRTPRSPGTLRLALVGRDVTEADLELLRDKVLFDRPPVAPRYGRFVTNCVAILVSGGLLFGLAGSGRVALAAADDRSRRMATLAIALAVIVLIVPLAATSVRLTRDALAEGTIRPVVERALAESRYVIESLDVEDGRASASCSRVPALTLASSSPARAPSSQRADSREEGRSGTRRTVPRAAARSRSP